MSLSDIDRRTGSGQRIFFENVGKGIVPRIRLAFAWKFPNAKRIPPDKPQHRKNPHRLFPFPEIVTYACVKRNMEPGLRVHRRAQERRKLSGGV
jgi:hypothetical protein